MRTTLALLLCTAALAVPLRADEAPPTPQQIQFFENKVRPLLADNCYRCHGQDRQRGGLRLDSRAALLEGGDTGPAVVPGRPADSLLIKAVHYDGLEMPPTKKLNAEQVAALETWVKVGAPWPGAETTAKVQPKAKAGAVTDADRQFWSFRPVQRPAVPATAGPAHPVDAFVRAKLAEKGVRPSPPADRRELCRRVYYDLIGLPPTPEEIDAFVKDPAPDAYEKLIDHLLARPQYGERWGRHWLDVVRFAQTSGYERDNEKPNAWRYRDYVIRAFNEDKPYDQFVREQFAGDELDEVTDDSLIATAFYRLGVWDDEPDDGRQAEFDDLDDMLSTASTAFLGLTVGCARCHDHKFDPIPHEDYYSLLAFLRNVRRYENPGKNAVGVVFSKLQGGGETLAVHEYDQPRPTHVLVRGSAATPGKEVTPRFVRVLCPSDAAATPQLPAKSANGKTSGRRRVLADWVASPEHPLTARVMVNRVWHYHFGRGIVATPNDFGKTGTAPTHPELLDWLASDFVAHGWRLKRLHKLILTSDTYKQSSRVRDPKAVETDPDNTLLWRQNLRRLEAEAVRDTLLAVSGQLNLKMGGRGVFPTLAPEVLSTQSRPGAGWDNNTPKSEQHRRSVYVFVKRTLGVPFLEVFDGASPDTSTARRSTTTIAPQALILLNSAFVQEQSAACADRLLRETGRDAGKNAERLFRLALGRGPGDEEIRIARDYLDRTRSRLRSENAEMKDETAYRQALAQLCKLVLNLNETVYID